MVLGQETSTLHQSSTFCWKLHRVSSDEAQRLSNDSDISSSPSFLHHSLKASTCCSECSSTFTLCDPLHANENTNSTIFETESPSSPVDSGFCETPQSPTVFQQDLTDEDALHEQRCVEEAKNLLIQCICTSSRINHYQLTQLLGYGTFGIVVEGVDPETGCSVAIKIMRKSQIHQNRVYTDPDTGCWSSLEVVLLKYSPPNDNIISFIDSWDDQNCLYLVTELGGYAWNYDSVDVCANMPVSLLNALGLPITTAVSTIGKTNFDTLSISLPDNSVQTVTIPMSPNDRSSAGLLRACGAFNSNIPRYEGKPILPEKVQKILFHQLVSAIMTLHQNGITHKDIKDENVLLDQHLNLRLIDFGHAAVYRTQSGDQVKRFKTYGTPVFSPPETRSQIEFDGPSADIYAMGLMLYEYNFGDVPDNFDEAEYVADGECIFEISEKTGFVSQECMDLCRWMLQPDPKNRPTIEQVASHPFLY